MTLEGCRPARGGIADPRRVVDMLADGRLISADQHEAGILYAVLEAGRDHRPLYGDLFGEIEVDLLKVNSVDLTFRVCCRQDYGLAMARLDDLRLALSVLALRFKQIELSSERAAGPAIA
jgi:hypothetical protein